MRRSLLLTLALSPLAACAPQAPETAAAPQPEPLVAHAESGDLAVETRLADPSPSVVDDVRLRYTLIGPGSLVATSPDWSASLPEELTLARADRIGTAPDAGSIESPIAAWDVTLTPLAPGEYEIAPLVFTAVDPASETGERRVVTRPLSITIESILGEEETDLADLKDPFAPPADRAALALAVAAGAVALAALIAGGVLLARRWGRDAVEPPIPPHERATLELDALLATDLIVRRAWKAYYTELTALLRRYIESRFELHAPAQTTDEFLRDSGTRRALSPEQNAQLANLLTRADLVKFAESSADERSAREAAGVVRRFIEETAPRAETTDRGETT